MPEEIVKIPLNKGRMAFLIIVCISFIAVGVFLMMTHWDQVQYTILAWVIGLVVLLFFGFAALYLLRKFFDPKPGLVIDDEGIIDNSSFVAAERIYWKNIKDVYVTRVRTSVILGKRYQDSLTFSVDNVEEIMARQKGFKKLLMNLNKRYYRSPVQVSSVILKSDFSQLAEIIKKCLGAYRAKERTHILNP
jgi:hypothetical protein